jgi:hypothetical protein
MILLKPEGSLNDLPLYIEQAAIQGGWTRIIQAMNGQVEEKYIPLKKVSVAYNTLLRIEAKTRNIKAFANIIDGHIGQNEQFIRDCIYLDRAIAYARRLIANSDELLKHEKSIQDFSIPIYFSICRYDAKMPPYDFNKYCEKDLKARFNELNKNSDHFSKLIHRVKRDINKNKGLI